MHKCCPNSPGEIDIDALRDGKIGSILCIYCGRWWIGPGSSIKPWNPGLTGPMSNDFFVYPEDQGGMGNGHVLNLRRIKVETANRTNAS
jgi:hypothetical protein